MLELAPELPRDAPHDLELVAVGVLSVERLRDAVVARAAERPDPTQLARRGREVLDRRDLPGEVIEAGRAARRPRRALADREQAQVVVVLPAARAHEHGTSAELARHDLEAEDAPVEVARDLSVADVQDGVVEPGHRDHGCASERVKSSGSGRPAGASYAGASEGAASRSIVSSASAALASSRTIPSRRNPATEWRRDRRAAGG